MFCRNCGDQIGTSKICPNCQTPAGEGNQRCPNCGKRVSMLAHKCEHCGSFFYEKQSGLDGHSKLLMALLAFFLGGLGIHNLVMGEIKKCITRIILTLVCGIGWLVALVDMIKIIANKYEINTDKFF